VVSLYRLLTHQDSAVKQYRIDNDECSDLDHRILGDCRGYVSMRSYLEAGFMATSASMIQIP
jgi:hypothetical protein